MEANRTTSGGYPLQGEPARLRPAEAVREAGRTPARTDSICLRFSAPVWRSPGMTGGGHSQNALKINYCFMDKTFYLI
jgi:hypothetical protein